MVAVGRRDPGQRQGQWGAPDSRALCLPLGGGLRKGVQCGREHLRTRVGAKVPSSRGRGLRLFRRPTLGPMLSTPYSRSPKACGFLACALSILTSH